MALVDRNVAHDLRNSIMVIRNLSELLVQDKLSGTEKTQAHELINKECEKILKLCE
jgi:signal transduction histidine kinase